MDIFEPAKRSAIMARVKCRDTKPEMLVRRLVHAMGYRYRLHRRDLPGRPDLVFPGRRKVIFVHGCFWHGHDCSKGKRPKTNAAFWAEKLDRNMERDQEVLKRLGELGWSCLTVWECRLDDTDVLSNRLHDFLSG